MNDPQLMLVFDGTTAARFEDFHRTNPHVYRTLVRLARQFINETGQPKVGISMLFEAARWSLAIETKSSDYRLNNSYRAYFARLIAAQEPDLKDCFELRSSAADGWVDHYLVTKAAS